MSDEKESNVLGLAGPPEARARTPALSASCLIEPTTGQAERSRNGGRTRRPHPG